jgi:hypothetical protein
MRARGSERAHLNTGNSVNSGSSFHLGIRQSVAHHPTARKWELTRTCRVGGSALIE